MATLAGRDLRPQGLVIGHSSLTIEGRSLENVALGGWVYGPELGTAPVVLIVGGITASPFLFGDGQAEGEDPRAAWWPALYAPELIDPAKQTVLFPSWPGNGSTRKGFDDPDAMDAISVAGLADLVTAWIDGCGCDIPSPGWARALAAWSASSLPPVNSSVPAKLSVAWVLAGIVAPLSICQLDRVTGVCAFWYTR